MTSKQTQTRTEQRFGAIILTHGRPDQVITYRSLRRHGYSGPIRLLIDDEDVRGPEYRERYPGEVIEFSKREIAATFDPGDITGDTRSSTYPRNASYDVARSLGWTYFVMLDDDYNHFHYRYPRPGPGSLWGSTYGTHPMRSLDDIFRAMTDLLDSTGVLTIAMAQGGDNIGGAKALRQQVRRKAMNSHVLRTDRPIRFVGRLNEDATAYCLWGSRGEIFLQTGLLQLEQTRTQRAAGGMTEAYRDGGTYVKSFYTVMMCPSFVDIRTMGRTDRRLHHHIRWDHAVPKIIAPEYRK